VSTNSIVGHKDIINFLITKDFDIRLPDTAYILQESYAFCSIMVLRPNMNPKQTGGIIVIAQDRLKEWLYNVFHESDKNYNFQDSIDTLISDLPHYFERWVKELMEDHCESIGQSIYRWMPIASAQYIQHIDFYIYSKFERTPDHFGSLLQVFINNRIQKLLSFWEKSKLLASLEKNIPEEVKRKLRQL